MNTYSVRTFSPKMPASGFVYEQSYQLVARTKGDAIMQAQKLMASEYGLTQTQECLVRVEFEN